jgi:hypothetical protein
MVLEKMAQSQGINKRQAKLVFIAFMLILPFSRPAWWALPESEMVRCRIAVEARYQKQYINILESRLNGETKQEIKRVYEKEAQKEIEAQCK